MGSVYIESSTNKKVITAPSENQPGWYITEGEHSADRFVFNHERKVGISNLGVRFMIFCARQEKKKPDVCRVKYIKLHPNLPCKTLTLFKLNEVGSGLAFVTPMLSFPCFKSCKELWPWRHKRGALTAATQQVVFTHVADKNNRGSNRQSSRHRCEDGDKRPLFEDELKC